ncbi:hypothetical protein CDAR_526901 [Caerostris darwini]|uniref:Uncharacterized protein n=1 Tax=Caerostris darwini TaxID=1538125 RepID=A0AAV4Q8I7_9ARAC|nr:hypothetical protein CDAR_526901 [Caerostris darwini]
MTTYTYHLLNMRRTPLATCYPNPSPGCVSEKKRARTQRKSESAKTKILGGHAPATKAAPDPRQSVAMCLDSWMAGT